MLVEGGDAEVELFFGDDQRRRDDEMADPGLNGHALRHHLGGDLVDDEGLAFHLVPHGVEELLGLAILHNLNGKEKAEAAHVADGGVFGLQGFELLADVRLELRGALDELEALHLFDGGDSRAESERVRLVSMPM